ncbi:MAG: hypothetical protein U0228_36785 [Myxococcaceae bacterium]
MGASASLAEVPKFKKGGFNFQIQYGPGFWTVDATKLGNDPGKDGLVVGATAATAFKGMLPDPGHTVSISAYYNILGHASIGADLTAQGWKLADPSRGGGGFLVGKVAWHPLELFFLQKEERPIGLDVNTYFGVGYGIVGGATSIAGLPTGMDGLLFEWGLNADYYFARYFGLGFFARGIFLSWDKFYFDYNNRDVPGNTVTLSQPLGGSMWTFGLSLTFRAGE